MTRLTLSSLEGGAVGGVEGGETRGLLGAVTEEPDHHVPGVGGQGDGGRDLVREARPGVELQTLEASVINLKWDSLCIVNIVGYFLSMSPAFSALQQLYL